jgi:hypothetical protein
LRLDTLTFSVYGKDLVKESISSSALTLELLGLLKRYGSSLSICRATLVPLGFLVTDGSSFFLLESPSNLI